MDIFLFPLLYDTYLRTYGAVLIFRVITYADVRMDFIRCLARISQAASSECEDGDMFSRDRRLSVYVICALCQGSMVNSGS